MLDLHYGSSIDIGVDKRFLADRVGAAPGLLVEVQVTLVFSLAVGLLQEFKHDII